MKQDLSERNKQLAQAYESGEPMTSISRRTGISCTQLSRIFRSMGVKRKKFELDREFFDNNKGKTLREIAHETNIPLKRVNHLYRIAYKRSVKRSRVDFTGDNPSVDPDLLYDKDWLTEQYVAKKLGSPTIARMLGTSSYRVIKQLREFGIKLRNVSESAAVKKKRPSREWLEKHYVDDKWSISKCAAEFGVSFMTIYSALEEYGIEMRSASGQHAGELNEFFGKKHDEAVAEYCRKIGAHYGRLYWVTGDVESKINKVKQLAKEIWADPARRAAQSERMTKLCMSGKCNSKQALYVRQRDSKSFLFRSSWEYAIALFLESCDLVDDWDYETLSIPVLHNGVFRNYIIDFEVRWKSGLTTYIECKNKYLLSKERETVKIETATKFLRSHKSNLTVIDDISDISNWNALYIPDDYVELNGNRYKTTTAYLSMKPILLELFRHYLVMRLVPWEPMCYSDDELRHDLSRIIGEKIERYTSNGLRASVPNSRGMPGRNIIVHFQPSFLETPMGDAIPLTKAFDDPWIIYRSLLQSMEERESLSLERLLREINFHFTKYSRVSHFAPGFARAVIRMMGSSGKSIFDPCCGWGGRLIGAHIEGSEYTGAELSPITWSGLQRIAEFIGAEFQIANESCFDIDWPDVDLIFTSPPFYNKERYIGGNQPWEAMRDRSEWVRSFVKPFAERCNNTDAKLAIYLDYETMVELSEYVEFTDVIDVSHKRHPRHKDGREYLCVRK